MQYTVEEAVQELLEEKQEIENRINLIQSIDWAKPVTEDVWHEICETPLRGTDLLKVLVTNIFPEAEDIRVGANYVNFKLRGFDVQIPTSRCRGINVGTNWYKNPNATVIEPRIHSETTKYMKMYFDAVDNKEGWKKQAKARLHRAGYNDFGLFIAWFGKYKWKKVDRECFEKQYQTEEENYRLRKEKKQQERNYVLEKVNIMKNEIIPILDKFSTKHFAYYDGSNHKTPEEIFKIENM